MDSLARLTAAAGQRLLLQAAPAPADALAPAPAAAASAPNDTGYEVSFSTSSCVNTTSPICYSTAISGENLITGMWVNLVIGLVCYLGFVLFRGMRGFEYYHARLLLPAVSRKPPQLSLHGHQRLWGWLQPVFSVSDEELVRSAGLDALVAVRIISFGVTLFLPMTLLGCAVLLPINYTSDYYTQYEEQDGGTDAYTSAFMRMTISNIRQRSPLLWVHFTAVYLVAGWTCWLIVEYYKEYIALRQTYLVRCTAVPGSGGSGGGTTPLLTPSMGASRSPLKRALAVAHSPTRRGPAAAAALGLLRSAAAASGPLGRAANRLKLPRRNASRGGEEFGEFAFRPSRFGTPSASPPGGSPTHGERPAPAPAPGDAAAGGSIFQYAPSRLGSSPGGQPAPGGAVALSDSSATAAQGLAAALASLPGVPPGGGGGGGGGSSGSAGIELSAAAAFGSGEAVPSGAALAEPSGASTPASDVGGAGGRARRPLLYHQQQRSSDHAASDSPAPPPPPSQQQQRGQQQEQRAAAGDAWDASLSLSLSPGLGDVGSLSLNGSRSDDDDADTAASRGPAGGAALAPTPPQPPTHPLQPASGGSAQSLLPPGRAESGASGLGPLLPPGGESSPPSGAVTRGAGSAAVLPLLGAGVPRSSGSPGADALPVAPRHGHASSVDVAAALGFDTAPPDPEQIYAAILARSAQRGAGDALPALHAGRARRGAEAAEAEAEGIATHWWTAHQPLGADGLERPLSVNQSITFKGAVRLSPPGGGGGGRQQQLAVNASLFTCLVMDMPLEQLKLRKLGVFPAVWRAAHLEPARSLSHAGTLGALGAGGTPTSARSAEDITAALDELERGQQAEGDRADLDAHAAGLKGAAARLASAWRNRRRLGEWRRDVRWAMYNKRVRAATDMFSELFGADFDSIIPIYPTASVDKLAHRWDATCAKLERLQQSLRDAPRAAPARAARLKQRVMRLQREAAQLQGDIAAERDAVLCDLPSTCFFATFRSQQAAAVATQTNLNPIMQRLFKVEPAPRPDDVNWPALQRSWWQRTMRPLYALPLILFFMLLPIGVFTGAFAQLTVALCGNPNDPAARSSSWYCSDDPWASFVRNALTSLAPSIVLSVYNMVFLPVMVYYAAQMEGQHTSLSALDRRCADLFFYWDVFNVFLGALFGGTVLAELQTFLQNPAHIWQALGSAIPAASNFFINYVMYRALVMSAFRLLYPHQAIVPAICKWLHLIPRAKTARDKLLEVPPRNCRYGRDIGIPVLMNFVMVCSMCVTSPLILPFGLLYFAGLWAVWRYQMLYVYQRQYESGGQFWPLVAHKVVGCQLIMVVFTACVLIFKGGYTQATLMLVTLPICLLRFDNYLSRRYDDLVRQVPLMAVLNAGRSSVPPDIYTPPPLRPGGQGWHPEWGKVWQHWGIGRYTV